MLVRLFPLTVVGDANLSGSSNSDIRGANIPCLAWCWLDRSQLLLDHDLGCLCGGQLFSWMSLMFELLMVVAACGMGI